MSVPSTEELIGKKCVPCEGGVPKLTPQEAQAYLATVPGWTLNEEATQIARQWALPDFVSGIAFFSMVADVAEQEAHHPDLHLTGYRNVAIEIYTHAIGGLSENDFILAAKINQIPVPGQG